jgi:FtsZ-binding cell division protein ZapB
MIGESQDRLATLATENNELRARVESLEKADKQREKTVEYLREATLGFQKTVEAVDGKIEKIKQALC